MGLSVALAFAFLALSLPGQRAVGRWLRVAAPIRPLLPFAEGTPARQQLAVRAGGLFVTWLVLVGAGWAQLNSDSRNVAKVKVIDGLAASKAGLVTGDRVVEVDGVPIDDFAQLKQHVALSDGRLNVVVSRDGARRSLQIDASDRLLGVTPLGEVTGGQALRSLGDAARFPLRLLPTWRDGPALGLSLSVLSFAWWLVVLLELAAFAVNFLASRGR